MIHLVAAGDGKLSKSIIVLGQGRSGTSLVTNILASMGVFVEDTIPADKFNENGYWESAEMVKINDEILEKFGGKWPNFYTMPAGWETSAAVEPLKVKSSEFVARLNNHEVWSVKDPRLSLTFPFWKQVLPEERRVIFCVRNPWSVARSIGEVSDLDVRSAGQLWFETNLWAMKNIANERTLLIHYENIIENAKSEATRIASFIGMQVKSDAKSIVSQRLTHHHATIEELVSEREMGWEPKLLYLLLLESKSNLEAFSKFAKALNSEDFLNWEDSQTGAKLLLLKKEAMNYKERYERLVDHPYVRIGIRLKSLLTRSTAKSS